MPLAPFRLAGPRDGGTRERELPRYRTRAMRTGARSHRSPFTRKKAIPVKPTRGHQGSGRSRWRGSERLESRMVLLPLPRRWTGARPTPRTCPSGLRRLHGLRSYFPRCIWMDSGHEHRYLLAVGRIGGPVDGSQIALL